MTELIDSSHSFYLNCETFNNTDAQIDAKIQISDRADILSRQDRWAVSVTRFALDTQASLFYVDPDPTATVTLELFSYRGTTAGAGGGGGQHRINKTKNFVSQTTFTLSKGASTLADLLEQLNERVPTISGDLTAQQMARVGDTSVAGAVAENYFPCGQWSVTASGRFQFKVAVRVQGKIRPPNNYHIHNHEYFVNIKMSEPMREILGFENCTSLVFGSESSLRAYRRIISQINALLPAYRNNIDNWRWDGAAVQKTNSNWYRYMYPLLSSIILDQVFFTERANQAGVNLPLWGASTSHARGTDIGNAHIPIQNTQAVSQQRPYWANNDRVIANFRSLKRATNNSQHEKTLFGKIEIIGDVLQVKGTPAQAGHNLKTPIDHTYNEATPEQKDDDADAKGAYVMNGKLAWGTWNRSFVIQVANSRQIYVNRNVLHGYVNNDNVGDGGYALSPVIGDTIYIPDSTHPEGNGDTVWQTYQRGVVQGVAEADYVRAVGIQADPCWLITFDTELETHVDRIENLVPIQNPGQPNNGFPQTRVAWGTRRIPYQPLVYIAAVDNTYNAVESSIVFVTTQEFPVIPGDTLYIGHTFGSSKTVHVVEAVNYVSGQVTIAANGVASIPNGTVVIGFSGNFEICHANDTFVTNLTAAIPAVVVPQAHVAVGAPLINHARLQTKINNILTYVENVDQISWSLTSVPGSSALRALSEDETGAPAANYINPDSGQVVISPGPFEGIIRGAGVGNTVVCSDLSQHIGASPYFRTAAPAAIGGPENNESLFPSHYFQIDATDTSGDYSDPGFRAFLSEHIDEDWLVQLSAIAGATVLTGKAQLPNNAGDDADVVEGNSGYVVQNVPPRRPYRLCTEIMLPTRLGYNNAVAQSPTLKYMLYTHNRENVPGFYGGGGLLVDGNQFDAAHGAVGQARGASFARFKFKSGFKDMDACQIVYKANATLSVKDNASGVNMSIRTQDFFESTLSGQVDLAFKYKSISLTSNDLQALPERTSDSNALQPVLSSYSLPTNFDASVLTNGSVKGFESTPYGTITFSENAARRYHSLSAIPGGLRQFTINAVLDPKDDTKSKQVCKLPPGGRFSCQLLFVRKK